MTFPRTLNQEDMQSGTEPRAQTPHPSVLSISVQKNHSLAQYLYFILAFFLFFMVLFDLT